MATISRIDFGMLGGSVFTGRDRGLTVRSTLRLDEQDELPNPVEVIIPETIYTISSSFFLGMFAPSIQKFNSKNEFLKKYVFTVPKKFEATIDRCIARVLTIA